MACRTWLHFPTLPTFYIPSQDLNQSHPSHPTENLFLQILLENWAGRTGNSKISSCSSANQQGNMVFWVSPPKRTKAKFQDASPVWTDGLKGAADHPDESNIVGRLTPNRNTTEHCWASSGHCGHWFSCNWDRRKCRSRSQPFIGLNLYDSDWAEADEADRPDWDTADRAKGTADWVCWTYWTSTGELPTLAALTCLTKWG